jgi:hypothetical protein
MEKLRYQELVACRGSPLLAYHWYGVVLYLREVCMSGNSHKMASVNIVDYVM